MLGKHGAFFNLVKEVLIVHPLINSLVLLDIFKKIDIIITGVALLGYKYPQIFKFMLTNYF